MPQAIRLDNIPIEMDGVPSQEVNSAMRERLFTPPLTPERQAMVDRALAQEGIGVGGLHAISEEAPAKEEPAAKTEPKKETKTATKAPKKQAIPTDSASAAESAPKKGKSFDDLLSSAMAGDKAAVAFVNDIGRLNGFDKIQVTKDGIQYQEDGQWKIASAEEMRPMYDQAVKGIEYFKQYAAKQNKGQPQQARQAIPADLDPTVIRSLRAKAILQGDVGDLVAYQRLPGQLEQARAMAAYRRALAAKGYGGGGYGESPNIEYQYLDDGSVLIVDKKTKQRLSLYDPKGRPAPLSRVNDMAAYSDELDARLAEVEKDGAELIPNGTDNPIVKLPGGRRVTYSQYLLAKEKAKTAPHGRGNLGTAAIGESK